MTTHLNNAEISELKKALGAMEGTAPLAPDFDAHPVPDNERRRMTPLAAALGTAVLAVAVFVPAMLVFGGDGSGPPGPAISEIETPTVTTVSEGFDTETTTPSPATVTSSVGPGEVPAEAWTATTLPESGSAQGLVALEDGLVALFSRKGEQGMDVWGSADGSAWDRIGRIEGWLVVHDVVAYKGRIIVVATSITDSGSASAPVSLVSEDGGKSWTQIELEGNVGDIVVTPSGLVAAGSVSGPIHPDVSINHAAIWLSDDGVAWRQGAVSDDPEGISSRIDSLVWDNGLNVLGSRGPHLNKETSIGIDQAPDPTLWTSEDGTVLSDWMPSDMVGFPQSAAATPHGIVAATYWSNPQAKDNSAVWASMDGSEWRQVSPETETGWEYTAVLSLDGLVVVVGHSTDGNDPAPRVWTSSDLAQWDSAPIIGSQDRARVQYLAVFDGVLLTAGYQSDGSSSVGFVAVQGDG